MELEHEFTVPVPVEQAWQVLLDVERIAPCMPGATLDAVDGDEFTGRLKVRLGAMTITYRGTVRIASRDENARTVTIEASGKEARGSGTASATVQARLHDDGGRTRVTVDTKLNVTGRPAQFGRGILAEVGGKLINRFAGNLAEEITRDDATTDAGGTPEAEPAATADTGIPTETATGTGAPTTPAESGTGAPAEAVTTEEAVPGPADAGIPPEGGAGTGFPAETAGAASAAEETGAPTETPTRRHDAEPIDLLQVAGPSVAKRAAPALVGLALLWTLWRIIRLVRRSRS